MVGTRGRLDLYVVDAFREVYVGIYESLAVPYILGAVVTEATMNLRQ